MISPSQYCTEKFISAFDLKKFGKEDAVLTVGYPRNDYLFKFTDDECKNIKLKLNIPMDKKLFYMHQHLEITNIVQKMVLKFRIL